MTPYHRTADNVQSPVPQNTFPAHKRFMLSEQPQMLQAQLRHGRDVYVAEIARLAVYCADSGEPEARS